MAYSSVVCFVVPIPQTVIGVAIVRIEIWGPACLRKNSRSSKVMPAPESKQHDSGLKESSVSEKNTISVAYFYPLNPYPVPISWLEFTVDSMTFRVLDFEEVDAGVDDEVDGSVDMSKGGGKEDAVMIVCAGCVLCLQLSLRK